MHPMAMQQQRMVNPQQNHPDQLSPSNAAAATTSTATTPTATTATTTAQERRGWLGKLRRRSGRIGGLRNGRRLPGYR